ncbi:beta-ketoacyl synthase N-terminal-like domain-containing protein [Streptomyces sp. 4N509B]|uniref:beta-ketoacyl synthase N-terminal-like domain-containing protein n=1 Tax=Streptomyces sp. 4N509B TaxID=3457413 RepID=UPI003FCFCC4A
MRAYVDGLREMSRPQLELMLARRHRDETEPIAVSGMGCRLPGGVNGPEALWRMLREGGAVTTKGAGPPTDSRGRPRWNLDAPDLAPLAATLAHGAFLPDVDLFDPEYFGVGEDEAAAMDPQQRVLVMAAAEALQDANLTREELGRSTVGVYVGSSTVEYPVARFRNGAAPDSITAHAAPGAALSGVAARTAVALGLNGPALTVDTACSSALVAVHLAVGALRRRECDVAVVGAVHLQLSPWTTLAFERSGVLSPSGTCRPFAADADGYVRAEGCGVLVLRRLGDARAGGDLPYGLVRGSAVHQHGARSGMAVPSGVGHRRVIEEALRSAGVEPERIGFVEAQANGLRIAEQVELEAVAAAYRGAGGTAPLHVGSAKANFGYLETASGALGLMKTLLALHHGEIPPQPHQGPRPPDIDPALLVPEEPVPWHGGADRFAAVNASGFTGTNAHVVLQAAEPVPPVEAADPPGPVPLTLCAHTPRALRDTAARLLDHLAGRDDWSHVTVCRTLALKRDRRPVRHTAAVGDRRELLDRLADAAAGRPGDRGAAPPPEGLWDGPGALCRLPPAAFTCRSYWLEECRWL